MGPHPLVAFFRWLARGLLLTWMIRRMSIVTDSSQYIRSAADDRAVSEGCYFDLAAAERVRTFFARFLRHSKGEWAGKPFELMPWQWNDVVAQLFGWKRADGSRRYRRGYIEVPKKNGKSALFSGIKSITFAFSFYSGLLDTAQARL